MSSEITQEQLDRNSGIYGVGDFRQMVKYKSSKNKGYVRFAATSDGKLAIEKFNNKIDVPLSWRSNTSEAHNKAIREKFAAGIAGDLRFMGETGDEIRDMILRPKKGKDGPDESGKALSRREIKAILDKFDEQFNTPSGRSMIMDEVFKTYMAKSGLKEFQTFNKDTKEAFIKKFLEPWNPGVDFSGVSYVVKLGKDAGADPAKRMQKSEMEFRSYLTSLDKCMAVAMKRVAVESSCKALAEAALNCKDSYGFALPDDLVGKAGSCLLALMETMDVKAEALGVSARGDGLQLFLKKILPAMVRQAVANARDFASGDEASVNAAVDDVLNFGNVMKTAREFLEGVDKIIAERGKKAESGEV